MDGDLFNGPCFALITGASQGLGRAIAVGLSTVVGANSVMAISARNVDGLKKTSELAKEARRVSGCHGDIDFRCVGADLSDIKDMTTLVENCVSGVASNQFKSAFLFHVAGSLGDISKEICDIVNPEEANNYYKFNVVHLFPITASFMKWRLRGNDDARTFVVNTTSLLAIQALTCFSLYCTSRAARDMLFKVFAAENPKVRVLNWAPGPLDTEMVDTILNTPNRHSTSFRKLKEDGKLLNCQQSVAKLLEVLREDNYESGAHVDYYD